MPVGQINCCVHGNETVQCGDKYYGFIGDFWVFSLDFLLISFSCHLD